VVRVLQKLALLKHANQLCFTKKERKGVLEFTALIFSKYDFRNFAYVIGLGVAFLEETNLLLKIEA
jgi:hypothetical protein